MGAERGVEEGGGFIQRDQLKQRARFPTSATEWVESGARGRWGGEYGGGSYRGEERVGTDLYRASPNKSEPAANLIKPVPSFWHPLFPADMLFFCKIQRAIFCHYPQL